jgi:2-oxoglutarate dehydrogenase E2 component (dihydrolipoamide succinyltransferase)
MSTIHDVKVPTVGESISEVTIGQWLKEDGSYCEMDEPICEIESDKASVEVSAPVGGILKIKSQSGETVPIGFIIAQVEEGTHQTLSTAPSITPMPSSLTAESHSKSSPQQATLAHPSPAAHKILAEKNISPIQVTGTGKDGRITKIDALQALPETKLSSSSPNLNTTNSLTHTSVSTSQSTSSDGITREKMTTLRKTIAKRLVEAKNHTAMLTTFNEVDMFQLMEVRKKYKESFKEKHQVGLGFMGFFTKACTLAMRDFPVVNAQIQDQDILFHQFVNVGVAVSTPKGLVVPVIKNAQNKSLHEIEKDILNMALKARDGKISIEDMQGGTFTITNGGVFGSMLSTPILNVPQSAILGMHNIVERPVAIKGQVVIHPIMYLALSYDHRIIDGRESVGFLYKVKEYLEDPTRLILEV